MEQLYMTLAG